MYSNDPLADWNAHCREQEAAHPEACPVCGAPNCEGADEDKLKPYYPYCNALCAEIDEQRNREFDNALAQELAETEKLAKEYWASKP
jgi:endogenous inhibitor of DNA gyrase (YacG/DUF329 family)